MFLCFVQTLLVANEEGEVAMGLAQAFYLVSVFRVNKPDALGQLDDPMSGEIAKQAEPGGGLLKGVEIAEVAASIDENEIVRFKDAGKFIAPVTCPR